jgi:uncharacterized membrane protein
MDATPAAPFAPPVQPTAGNLFSLAHRLYTSRWRLIVGTSVAALVLNWLIAAIAGLLDLAIVGRDAVISPLSTLTQILVGAPLLVGPLYVATRLFRGEPAEFADLFVGFERWIPVVAVALLVQVIVYVAVIPIGVALAAVGLGTGGNPAAVAGVALLGLLLFGVVIWLSIRLYFATLLCADRRGPRLGAIESIKTSWGITRGHAWALFVVAVGLGILAAISLVLLVVPFLLYGAPILVCAGAVAYALICHDAGLIPLAPYDDCPYCKYDLRATESTTCPECGSTVLRAQTTETADTAPVLS